VRGRAARFLLVLSAVLFWASFPLRAEEGSPRVTSVSLDAPAAETARLARYLEIKVGEPLDPAAVRHVVELLFATGEFQDVVAETTPGPDGVALVFRPVPAPLLREVRVEGDRVLRAEAARRITRLRSREPLWPARLDRAAQELSLALVDKGYLEGRVTARVEGSGAEADVVFRLQSGPQVRVRAATVEGGGAQQSALQLLARPQPGKPFVRQKAQEAAENMRRHLVKSDRWAAAVTVRESFDPGHAAMTLVFEVTKVEPVRLVFQGAEVPGAQRREVTRLLREGFLSRDALEEATEHLEAWLRARGHREPDVRYVESSGVPWRVVTFSVNPGSLTLVASVSVEGDGPAGLARLVATSPQAPVQDRLLDEDVRTLQRALEERGYASAKVEAEVPEGGGQVPVVFRVTAGPRTVVSAIEVDSPVALPADVGGRELRTRDATPYRVRDVARDRDALLTAYRNAGHLQAVVTPDVIFSEDRTNATVIFRVRPGPVTRIDHVVVAPLPHTREEVIRRELTLKEGEPLSVERLLESQRKLSGLGLFDRVTITEMDPEQPVRTVVVRAEEAPLFSVAYGIGYGKREYLRGSVEVTRRNLFGMDRRLSTFVRASFKGSRFVVTYREPQFLRPQQELFVSGYREEEDRDAFSYTRQGLSVQAVRPLSPRFNLLVREIYQRTRTYGLTDCVGVDRQFCPSTLSGPAASLVFDTRDDALDPRRGYFGLLDGQLSQRALGGDNLLKGYVQGATYQPLTARVLVALSARLGLGRTFGSTDPHLAPPDRFFAGGDYSLRGFGVDKVRPEGGNAMVLGGAELRADMTRAWSLAAFVEAGNVYSLARDLSLSDLRYTAGLGLRYRSAVGPLRVDWGYKLDRRLEPVKEEAYQLHFTIGHAF
jgi:outer membrane protein insertion porin family